MLREFRRWVKAVERGFCTDVWCIGVCDVPIEKFLDAQFHPVPHWLPEPSGFGYYADPFAFGDRILCEYVNLLGWNRGVITLLDGCGENSVQVLKEPWHLSYPYVVEDQGRLLCAPEAHESMKLCLYELDKQGHMWKGVSTLLDVPAVDPTIVLWQNHWWLFATIADPANVLVANQNLHLWYADNVSGPWHWHPANPISTDPATARSGGTPFEFDGALYRPAQDCSATYGGALNLMEITTLNETAFAERFVRRINPVPPYDCGIHTLSIYDQKRTLIDGKRRAFAPWFLPTKLLRVLRGSHVKV
jgi:hypothetical protein